MRAAILLGVSNYNTPLASLPACLSDVKLMEKVLGATGKYNEMLAISEDTASAQVKARITDWIEDLRGKKIDEILFYYTGHGDFHKGEFCFPLSDFEKEKRKQTSLSNSEVDTWLRSLSPELAIKVVDACHAGIPYVKDDTQAFEKYLQKSGNEFKRCYFMFSSALEQSSYQDDELSYFTRSFVEAIRNHPAGIIRYRDIIDSISDDFESNSQQSPFFVMQAHNTEVFCSVTAELQSAIMTIAQASIQEEQKPDVQPSVALSLKQIVQRDAKKYCIEEEVLEILSEIKGKIENHQYPEDFCDLYEVEYSSEKYLASIPKEFVIGQWLAKSDQDFFAEPTYTEESYEVEDSASRLSQALFMSPTIWKTKDRVDGFKLTVDIPYKLIKIIAKPKFPNIPWSNCTIVFLISKTRIRFFHFYTDYRERNWQERDLLEDVKWQTAEHALKEPEAIWSYLENVQVEFANGLVTRIKEQFDANKTGLEQ